MHIALITEVLLPGDPVGQQVCAVARRLVEDGHRVTLLSGISIEPDLDERVAIFSPKSVARLRSWRMLRFSRWARAKTASIMPDRVLSFTPIVPGDIVVPPGGTVRGRYHAKLAQQRALPERARLTASQLTPYVLLRRLLEAHALRSRRITNYVALSTAIQAQLNRYAGSGRAGVRTASAPITGPDAVDASAKQRRDRLARAWGVDVSACWVALPFVSARDAGLEVLIGAFKALIDGGADTVLLLAGRCRYTHLAWIAQLGIRDRVRFVGPCDHPEQLLAVSDVAAYPTPYDPGGWGVRPALACGCPVITTTASDAATAVREWGGVVLDSPADPLALLGALREAVARGPRALDRLAETPVADAEEAPDALAGVVAGLLVGEISPEGTSGGG